MFIYQFFSVSLFYYYCSSCHLFITMEMKKVPNIQDPYLALSTKNFQQVSGLSMSILFNKYYKYPFPPATIAQYNIPNPLAYPVADSKPNYAMLSPVTIFFVFSPQAKAVDFTPILISSVLS